MKTATVWAHAGLAVTALCATSAHAALVYTPIAFTGTTGPLGPGIAGVTFTGFQPPLQGPSVNSAGQVGFRGITTSAGGAHGAFLFSAGANTNLALAGGAVPGGGTFNTGTNVFGPVNINASGEYVVRGSGTTAGTIASQGGVPHRANIIGDVAPGTGPTPAQSTTFSTAANSLMNNAGQVAFVASLANSATSVPATVSTAGVANNSGLWIGLPGSMNLALRQNDTASIIDPGGNARLGTFNANTLALNHSGKFLVVNTLQGTVTSGTGAGSNNIAILSNRTGSLEKIARVGDAAPDATGAPTSDLFRAFSNVGMGFNNAGRVAVQGTLRDAAGTQTSTGSLFTDAGTDVFRQVVRAGGTLPTFVGETPGEFTGVTWGNPGTGPALSGSDVLAFTTTLTGAPTGTTNMLVTMQNVSGVDTFTRILRSGDTVFPGGVLVNGFNSVGGTSINNVGQLAFQVSLTGPGVTSTNNSALFGWDPVAGLIAVARSGDTMATPFGTKTIASFGTVSSTATGTEDGRASVLAGNGNFAFTVVFTDLFEAVYLTQIPTPGVLPLLGLAGACAARRRRS
jgi:hypothetical protein